MKETKQDLMTKYGMNETHARMMLLVKEGLSISVIAERTGFSVGTTKSYISRARAMMGLTNKATSARFKK